MERINNSSKIDAYQEFQRSVLAAKLSVSFNSKQFRPNGNYSGTREHTHCMQDDAKRSDSIAKLHLIPIPRSNVFFAQC